ncbi:MAG: glycerophosphodiester phosphodiesterase family protein [Chakrabartia sp.]
MPLSLFAPLDALLAPPPAPGRGSWLKVHRYAHRGLHGPDVIENSRAAFKAAIAGGFGIELDVQASRDGEAFVFHDRDLDRLAETPGRLGALQSPELDQIRLKGSDETIPRLSEILTLIDGRVPLLVEVKTGRRDIAPLCQSVRRALSGVAGPVAIMSFDPAVPRWFAQNMPDMVRGLVVTEEGPTALPDRVRAGIGRHRDLWQARPDFLAYDVADLQSSFVQAQRRRGFPILSWTIRSPAEHEKVAAYADAPIFEVEAP